MDYFVNSSEDHPYFLQSLWFIVEHAFARNWHVLTDVYFCIIFTQYYFFGNIINISILFIIGLSMRFSHIGNYVRCNTL
ncbi:hypothetical protein HUJ04_001917, partial [Dendroctonus ponderosae]